MAHYKMVSVETYDVQSGTASHPLTITRIYYFNGNFVKLLSDDLWTMIIFCQNIVSSVSGCRLARLLRRNLRLASRLWNIWCFCHWIGVKRNWAPNIRLRSKILYNLHNFSKLLHYKMHQISISSTRKDTNTSYTDVWYHHRIAYYW